MLSSEAFSRKSGNIAVKSSTDSKKNETGDLWDLLKKTQSEVNSIENEIKRVVTENIHQGEGLTNLSGFTDGLFCLERLGIELNRIIH